jgi:hypothetical protein
MGVDKAYPLFAAMLTARPYDEIIKRSKIGSFGEKSALPESQADRAVIRGYAKQFMKDILVLLWTLPPQMLWLLKMNDCLRHIDFTLGSPTNTIIIAGKYAAKAVYLQDLVVYSQGTPGELPRERRVPRNLVPLSFPVPRLDVPSMFPCFTSSIAYY